MLSARTQKGQGSLSLAAENTPTLSFCPPTPTACRYHRLSLLLAPAAHNPWHLLPAEPPHSWSPAFPDGPETTFLHPSLALLKSFHWPHCLQAEARCPQCPALTASPARLHLPLHHHPSQPLTQSSTWLPRPPWRKGLGLYSCSSLSRRPLRRVNSSASFKSPLQHHLSQGNLLQTTRWGQRALLGAPRQPEYIALQPRPFSGELFVFPCRPLRAGTMPSSTCARVSSEPDTQVLIPLVPFTSLSFVIYKMRTKTVPAT